MLQACGWPVGKKNRAAMRCHWCPPPNEEDASKGCGLPCVAEMFVAADPVQKPFREEPFPKKPQPSPSPHPPPTVAPEPCAEDPWTGCDDQWEQSKPSPSGANANDEYLEAARWLAQFLADYGERGFGALTKGGMKRKERPSIHEEVLHRLAAIGESVITRLCLRLAAKKHRTAEVYHLTTSS